MNRFFIVGTGPGDKNYMTMSSLEAIKLSHWVVGYKFYIDILGGLLEGKEIFASGMGNEIERVRFAINKFKEGYNVAVVSGGDSSLYGLASLCFELGDGIEFEVIPGISAVFAASAKLGSPITDDLLIISLSDQLTPREIILKRVDAANFGDLVAAIYNPSSKKRKDLLPYTVEKFLQVRGDLPVGIVKHCTRIGEKVEITRLSKIDYDEIDMFTILIVGNTKTYIKNGKMITPRGYLEKYEKD